MESYTWMIAIIKSVKMFVKHAVIDSAFLKNLTSIMSLHGANYEQSSYGEETEVVIDYLKDRGLPVAIEKTC